jgi:protein-S-isoprenylcysteine O-methyltransferase Ste14
VADPALVRALTLLVPLCLTLGLVAHRRPDRRLAAAAFLASAWAFASSLALNLLAASLGWWTFDARGGLFLGVPVDLWLGWALGWGAVPILAFPRAPLWLLVVAIAWIDVVAMPVSDPVVRLGPSWLLGEALGLGLCFLPAQLVGRWTLDGRRLPARAAAQVAIFAALSLWVLPSAILEATGVSWRPLIDAHNWRLGLAAQLLAVPATMGAAAVLEFARRGRGTPFPWDPPERLVASGPYAYVANPMQLSMTLLMLGLGILLGSLPVALAGLAAGAFGAGFARWQERGDLIARFGPAWRDYERAVRPWLPTWRPAPLAPAALYYAESCFECSQVGAWFAARAPVALDLRPAERYDGPPPTRITYVAADGRVHAGVDALAHALDHLNLAWAWLGWLLRLPGVRHAIQLLADALGAEPRALPTRYTMPEG